MARRNRESIEAALREHAIPNLHFHYVAVRYAWTKKSEALHYMCWQMAALKAARKIAAVFSFDLAHHVTYASVHVPSPLWRLGIPVVFGPVGGGQVAPAGMLPYFGSGKSRERLRSFMTRSLKWSPMHRRWLQCMSVVLAANRDTLDILQRLGCKNTSLMCDTAICESYFADAPRNFEEHNRPLKLLWVGRMLTRKALPLALDAIRKVHENVTLTIAGDGMPPQTVCQMIRERNLEQRVFWKGARLTQPDLRMAYADHDAMLFTSLRDSFGSQVLEAMAMGLPIITLDLHGGRDWVPQGASFKVPVATPGETVRRLAKAIEQFASMPTPGKNQMSLQAWTFARAQSWSARAELVEKLYDEVLSRSTPVRNPSTSRTAAIGA